MFPYAAAAPVHVESLIRNDGREAFQISQHAGPTHSSRPAGSSDAAAPNTNGRIDRCFYVT